jgi:GAF domain-containing protein
VLDTTPQDDPRAHRSALVAGLPLSSGDALARIQALVREAVAATGMANGTVNLFAGDVQRQVGASGFAAADSPLETSICAELTGWTPDVYAFADLAEEPGFAGSPWVDGQQAHVRGYASAPLTVAGTTIGTLCVFDESPTSLTLEQCDRLARLADRVVDVLAR